jgi:3-methyladenine DNA glycosylase AlkD
VADNYYRSQLKIAGTRIPELRRQAKLLGVPTDPTLRTLNAQYLKTRSFEERYIILHRMDSWASQSDPRTAAKELFSKRWVDGIENWAHSDTLSSTLSSLLDRLDRPSAFYRILDAWSRSPHPWYRRQSLVSLFYYASTRKKYPKWIDVGSKLKRLALDSDFYVQRGVGWCLRESFRVYPKETLRMFESQLLKWSSIAFTTAIEKQSQGDRNRWKQQRRINRT